MRPTALQIACVAFVVILLVWVANWDPFGSKARLKTKAANAEAQVVVSDATTKAVDQVATTTAKAEEHSHVVIQRIQAAAGADTPIPPDVLSSWRGGLSDDPGSSDYRTGKPPRSVR